MVHFASSVSLPECTQNSAFLFEGKYLNTFPKPSFFDTPQKFNMAPEKIMVGILVSFGDGIFSGAMLNFQGVSFCQNPWINYSSKQKTTKIWLLNRGISKKKDVA